MGEDTRRAHVILVAEADAILALDLEDDLRRHGYDVAGPFSTCADTMGWLGRDRPAAALLDPALRDGSCAAAVDHLRREGVPFALCRGAGGLGPVDPAGSAAVFEKPFDASQVRRLLATLLGAA